MQRNPNFRELRTARAQARREARAWLKDNPRKAGETLPAYRRRARTEIEGRLVEANPDEVGAWWVQVVLMFLPLVIEWLTNR